MPDDRPSTTFLRLVRCLGSAWADTAFPFDDYTKGRDDQRKEVMAALAKDFGFDLDGFRSAIADEMHKTREINRRADKPRHGEE